MPLEFQDLIHEKLDIRLPGYSIQRMALHRHFPRLGEVEPHFHGDHEQALLYLRGRGVQIIEDKEFPVRRGSLVFLQRATEHSFIREREQSPLCLALNFECPDAPAWNQLSILSSESLGKVETNLKALATPSNELEIARGILEVLEVLQRTAHGLATRTGPWSARVRKFLENHDLRDVSPSLVAEALGLNPDVINRHLRRETSVSLGRMVAAFRIDKACQLLRSTSLPVGEVGERIGILDRNYFTRWFRQQTGQTPGNWRQSR